MDNYFLTDKLSFSIIPENDISQRYYVMIGARAFYCSKTAFRIIAAVEKYADIDQIAHCVNADKDRVALDPGTIRELIEQRFIPAGLVSISPENNNLLAKQRSYLFLAFTLLSPKFAGSFGEKFVWLLNRNVVPAALALSLGSILCWMWSVLSAPMNPWSPGSGYGITLGDSILMYSLVFLSFLFHELGHAAASQRYRVPPAEIGFGLYLIFPVFYCNVTKIWGLPRFQRIVVSLAGPYFHLVAAAIMVPFQLISGSQVLSLVIAANIVSVLLNLNPFFRFDGYWIYSDYFSIPNLRQRSRETMVRAAYMVLGHAFPAGRSSAALRVYAAGSAIFFTGFMFFAIKLTWSTVSDLPQLLKIAASNLSASSDIESLVSIVAASGSYLFLLLGCILTSLYILITIMRGVRSFISKKNIPLAVKTGSLHG